MGNPGDKPNAGLDKHTLRDGNGLFIKSLETAERDAEACRMRNEGKTYVTIAKALGFADATIARRAVQRGMLAVVQEAGEELRQLELERLDWMWRKVLDIAQSNHWTVQHGKVVTFNVGTEENPEWVPVPDMAPILGAMDRLLKIQERRARLTGLDKPVQVQVLSDAFLEEQIARLRASVAVINQEPREIEG